MGIIKSQGIKQSLVNFIAAGIGAVSTIMIYPLEKEAYGLARFLLGMSFFLFPFICLGFNSVTIRFFPEFKQSNNRHNGFLGMLLLVMAFGSLTFFILAWLFKDSIYGMYSDSSPLFRQFLPFLVPMAIFVSCFHILINYSINHHRTVVPAIFQNLIKLTLPLLILLVAYGHFSMVGMAYGLVINYLVALLAMVAYLYALKVWYWRPDFSFLTKERWKRLWNYAGYGLMASIGSVLATRIDEIMIPNLIDFRSNGVYAIAAFIGNTILIPGMALMQISSPLIAQLLKDDKVAEVEVIYKKASINLTIIGLFFFVGIIVSVEDLFSIMPKSEELHGGFMIVLLIGLARVIDMTTSVNNQIIAYSRYYRFGMYAILMMGALNITFNLLLIPRYGIVGAAMATLLSLLLYNTIKLSFIYFRFKIQPFSWKTLFLFVWAAITFGAATLFPDLGTPWGNILIRSLVVLVVFVPIILYLRISEDINGLLRQGLDKLKSFF